MKKSILFTALFLLGMQAAFAQKQGKLTVNWKFLNIVEGYDHESKCVIYIDDEEAGVSSVKKESVPNSMTISTSQGSHNVRVVNYALYEGEWEEHSIANNYSIDCLWEGELNIKSQTKLNLYFDIDNGTTTKPPKKKKK